MASMNYDVDAIGGGGWGGFGGFGGGCGIIVILIILFAVFSGGGLFGRDGCRERDHDRDFDELRAKFSNHCNCVSNCQIDKDVVTSRDAGILEQHKILEQNLERKLIERDMIIQEQKNQLFVGGMFANLEKELCAKFGMIERELEHKPNAVPHWAKTVDACTQPQLNCFDRGREFFDGRRRDRDDRDCGGCWC